jgi:hypothetical protein
MTKQRGGFACCFAVLGFELRALHLQGRCFPAEAAPPANLLSFILTIRSTAVLGTSLKCTVFRM